MTTGRINQVSTVRRCKGLRPAETSSEEQGVSLAVRSTSARGKRRNDGRRRASSSAS